NAIKQSSIAFVLSDFVDNTYEEALKIAGKKHDLIGVKIYDQMDKELPNVGLLQILDAESGITQWVDTSNAYVRRKYEENFFMDTEYCVNAFRKAGSDLLHIQTGDDYVNVL